jgi:hypothetical protein
MSTEKDKEYFERAEQEYYELADEAAQLVHRMRNTSDEQARTEIRKQLTPIDKRKYELDCEMGEFYGWY